MYFVINPLVIHSKRPPLCKLTQWMKLNKNLHHYTHRGILSLTLIKGEVTCVCTTTSGDVVISILCWSPIYRYMSSNNKNAFN